MKTELENIPEGYSKLDGKHFAISEDGQYVRCLKCRQYMVRYIMDKHFCGVLK